MRVSGIVWIASVACAIAAGAWGVKHLGHPARPTQAPQATVPVAEDLLLPEAADARGQSYWHDPSVDPRVLERAFAPPPPAASLPPEARPKSPAIEPPDRQWRRLQRKEDAVAY